MSDTKEAFRFAAASSGMSKAQARALRAQRKAKAGTATASQATSASEKSIESVVDTPRVTHSSSELATVSAPSSNVPQAPSGAAATGAPLPKGFFDDRQADAQAHGEKTLSKRDKESEFERFQMEMEEQMKKQAEEESREADQATARQHAEEEFEIRSRMNRIEQLRKRDVPHGVDAASFISGLTAKKLRMQDIVVALQTDEGDTDDDLDDSSDDLAIDWRSKKM